VVAARLFPQRLGAQLLGIFGALSLLLAAFGIYAVVSWAARRRTRELGIRMALGARSADLHRLVFGQAASVRRGGSPHRRGSRGRRRPLPFGALYGVSPADPAPSPAAAAVIALAALAAAYVPARRRLASTR
jgi:hypothetical protein